MTGDETAVELSFVVTEADTAQAVGSGSLPVLGTPRLLAWCEAATCAAATGADGTTVGTRVELDHLAASPIGARVRVSARLVATQGRSLEFAVTAVDEESGRELARGVVQRAAVNPERFMARLDG